MTREEAIKILEEERDVYIPKWIKRIKLDFFDRRWVNALELAIKALEQEACDDIGEVSDGYHTFNQLYHQRAVLFATIVNQNKDKSWKSFKHSDGNYCFDRNGEWFIVGIDTPQGSYTYHYAKEYWDMFDCEELECGKEWDGHTEEDVTRLLSLQNEPCEGRMKYVQETVNTIMNSCKTDSIKDKCFRNAARFIQNAIDGSSPEFELIKDAEPCEDAISRQAVLDAITRVGLFKNEIKEAQAVAECLRAVEALSPVTARSLASHR